MINCRNTYRTYSWGGESIVLNEHEASNMFGGDCSCSLAVEFGNETPEPIGNDAAEPINFDADFIPF